MDSRNPDELINKVKEKQESRGELATEALQWFLDDNVGELFPRSDVVDKLSQELNITSEQANTAVADTVGDIVDPVQQIPIDGTRYVGIVEYKLYQNEGAYGYVDIDDVLGKRKRVVCAKCVEDATHDARVTHATQGKGSTPQDASWKALLNKVTAHYADSHTDGPETVRPGASLLNGTTISGNIAFHKGNDGIGSGFNADKVDGSHADDIGGIASDRVMESDETIVIEETESAVVLDFFEVGNGDLTVKGDMFIGEIGG